MVTVAICTFNRHRLLKNAINSVLPQLEALEGSRMLIIDNSSDTSTAKVCQSYVHALGKNICYVITPSLGLSAARNEACKRCVTPHIAFIDDDARALPGWVASIMSSFVSLPHRTAAVGGPVLLDWRSERPIWLTDTLVGYLSAFDLGEHRRFLLPGEWLIGTNIAFNISLLNSVHGFDTQLGRGSNSLMGNEDIDVVRRLLSAGCEVVYEPAVKVLHSVLSHRLSQDWFRCRFIWQAISDEIMNNPMVSTIYQSLPGSNSDALSMLPMELREVTEEPDAFTQQCFQIYQYTKTMNAG